MLTVFGAAIPFFLRSNLQYFLSPLPAFWIGKAVLQDSPLFMLPALVLSALWICVLLKGYLRKAQAGQPVRMPLPPAGFQVDRSTSSQSHMSSQPASQNRERWRSMTTPASKFRGAGIPITRASTQAQ